MHTACPEELVLIWMITPTTARAVTVGADARRALAAAAPSATAAPATDAQRLIRPGSPDWSLTR